MRAVVSMVVAAMYMPMSMTMHMRVFHGILPKEGINKLIPRPRLERQRLHEAPRFRLLQRKARRVQINTITGRSGVVG